MEGDLMNSVQRLDANETTGIRILLDIVVKSVIPHMNSLLRFFNPLSKTEFGALQQLFGKLTGYQVIIPSETLVSFYSISFILPF